MSVLFLTLFLSFLLALFFLVLFFINQRRDCHGSPEQHSLIPFRDQDSPAEKPSPDPDDAADPRV